MLCSLVDPRIGCEEFDNLNLLFNRSSGLQELVDDDLESLCVGFAHKKIYVLR